MWTCPVCKSEKNATLCPNCGLDESRDYRNYRFLGMLSEANRKILKIKPLEDYNNILMKGSHKMNYVFGRQLYRQLIKTIHFQNHKKNIGANAWDVSEKQDGSVLAWTQKVGDERLRKQALYLAADGMIKANRDCSWLFYEYDNLEEIFGLEFLQTDQTETMYNMFCECKKLRSLDLSGFDTSKVTNMKYMFACCENLQNLDVSSFDTSQVTNMRSMFAWCKNLQNLDVRSFNTSLVTDMKDMFLGCENLQNLDVSHFHIGNVKNRYTSLKKYIGLPRRRDDRYYYW